MLESNVSLSIKRNSELYLEISRKELDTKLILGTVKGKSILGTMILLSFTECVQAHNCLGISI